MLGKKLFAENPLRIEEGILREIDCVRVLNDAANLHVWKGEGFRHVLQPFCLGDGLLGVPAQRDFALRERRPVFLLGVEAPIFLKRFEDRVTNYVEQQLEAAFTRGEVPTTPYKLAAGGLGIALLSLLVLLACVVAVVLVVKLLF